MPKVAAYDPIAPEYYDPRKHPTCANFSELSYRILAPRIERYATRGSMVAEIGAGRSITAGVLYERNIPLNRLLLLDDSFGMLAHSRRWLEFGAMLVVADARATSIRSDSVDLLVASLGDPYHGPAMWAEAKRILKSRAVGLFTTPAVEWANAFRGEADRAQAEFVLANGRMHFVPSHIPAEADQIKMMEAAGLVVEEVEVLKADQLDSAVSPKLLINSDRNSVLPVLRGFRFRSL